jgi:hypothetical protein
MYSHGTFALSQYFDFPERSIISNKNGQQDEIGFSISPPLSFARLHFLAHTTFLTGSIFSQLCFREKEALPT